MDHFIDSSQEFHCAFAPEVSISKGCEGNSIPWFLFLHVSSSLIFSYPRDDRIDENDLCLSWRSPMRIFFRSWLFVHLAFSQYSVIRSFHAHLVFLLSFGTRYQLLIWSPVPVGEIAIPYAYHEVHYIIAFTASKVAFTDFKILCNSCRIRVVASSYSRLWKSRFFFIWMNAFEWDKIQSSHSFMSPDASSVYDALKVISTKRGHHIFWRICCPCVQTLSAFAP